MFFFFLVYPPKVYSSFPTHLVFLPLSFPIASSSFFSPSSFFSLSVSSCSSNLSFLPSSPTPPKVYIYSSFLTPFCLSPPPTATSLLLHNKHCVGGGSTMSLQDACLLSLFKFLHTDVAWRLRDWLPPLSSISPRFFLPYPVPLSLLPLFRYSWTPWCFLMLISCFAPLGWVLSS